jgi:excisionase family DNA binding protein
MEPERWLRVEDAAKYANVSVHYLRGLLRKRELPPLRAGKHFLVDCLDLDRYFEKLKAQRQARSNGDGHLTS